MRIPEEGESTNGSDRRIDRSASDALDRPVMPDTIVGIAASALSIDGTVGMNSARETRLNPPYGHLLPRDAHGAVVAVDADDLVCVAEPV